MDVSGTPSGGGVGEEDVRTRGEHVEALVGTTRGGHVVERFRRRASFRGPRDSFGKYEPASAHPRQIRHAPPRTRSAPSAHPSIARSR